MGRMLNFLNFVRLISVNKLMKKILSIVIPALFVAGVVYAQPTNLWQYFNEKGEVLPSFSERANLAEDIGIEGYRGTVEQNSKILNFLLGLEGEGEEPVLGAESGFLIAGATYNLAGSGVSGSATSITLQSFTIPQTGQKIADSDLADTFYVTLEPGNRTRQEIASCTTVTQNSGGTATLSGCARGLSPLTPYTASTTLQIAHAGGAQVIFSDPPQLFNQFVNKTASSTVTGLITYATSTTGMFSAADGVYFRIGDGSGNITNKCVYINNGDATPPKFCFNDTTNKWLIYNDGVSSYDITAGGSALTAHVPVYLDSSAIKVATSTLWFDLDSSNSGTARLRVATSTIAGGTATGSGFDLAWNARWNASTTKPLDFTFSDNLTVGGNATTTGSHNFGEIGFDGGDVISKWPFFNAYASSSERIINSNVWYVHSYTSPSLNVFDTVHVVGTIFTNGSSDTGDCPNIVLRFDSATSTLAPNLVSTGDSGNKHLSFEAWLRNSHVAGKSYLQIATTTGLGIGSFSTIAPLRQEGYASTTVNMNDGVLVDLSIEDTGSTCTVFENFFSVDVIRNGYHP